jgi:hypothetical protein
MALVSCVAGIACSQDAGVEQAVTLEVRDGWIREPGAECAGSRPLLYVHRDAAFEVEESPGGQEVSDGVLPAGLAVEAVEEDLEEKRVPTFCQFQFDVSVPGPGDYRLVLSEGAPLEFTIVDDTSEVSLILP